MNLDVIAEENLQNANRFVFVTVKKMFPDKYIFIMRTGFSDLSQMLLNKRI
jgi:hypothetical protein